ncbi:MAG TPA: carboxylesterase family protein [Flavisolibacter sp.]|nr:carboxylesterase family protein [Flavisolibacter sp.]
MKRFLLLALSLPLALPQLAQSKAQTTKAEMISKELQVETANGVVEGVQEKNGIRSFKGIPYAAPPVGKLRWREPQPAANWKGVLKADKFGPKAMQAPIFGDMNFRSNGTSENCLYLNVWTPVRKGKELLPVLVYFYGGGFVAGDGSEPRYDGESMARKGIVALTVNYRLGVFGFLSHPELTEESPHKASGNYGLLDQAAALQWVQENIAAFGGDPKRVTIAGESAGSVSVSALMASPLSKNKIAGAIGESGSLLGTLPAVSLGEAEQVGVTFAQSIGAHSLTELRAISADSLLSASMRFGPFRFPRSIDGYFFPKNPYAIYEAGEQAQVPLLAGWNNEEMNYRALMGNDTLTRENFAKVIQRLYGNQAAEVLQLYNPVNDKEVEQVATDLASDRFISFSTWKWADIHSQTAKQHVYRYIYEKARPEMVPEMGDAVPGLAGGVQRGTGAPKPLPNKGAVHSAEIEYAMGNLSTNKVFAWTEEDYKVSRIMQEYFANFIKKGDPNGKGLPTWPSATNSVPVPVMHINVHTRVEEEKHRERYLFMDRSSRKK